MRQADHASHFNPKAPIEEVLTRPAKGEPTETLCSEMTPTRTDLCVCVTPHTYTQADQKAVFSWAHQTQKFIKHQMASFVRKSLRAFLRVCFCVPVWLYSTVYMGPSCYLCLIHNRQQICMTHKHRLILVIQHLKNAAALIPKHGLLRNGASAMGFAHISE